MNDVSIAIGYINGSERYYGDKDHLLNQMQSGRETKKSSEYFFFTFAGRQRELLVKNVSQYIDIVNTNAIL